MEFVIKNDIDSYPLCSVAFNMDVVYSRCGYRKKK